MCIIIILSLSLSPLSLSLFPPFSFSLSSALHRTTTIKVGYTKAAQVHPNVLKRVKREDPAEYSIMSHPHHYASLTQRNFQGRQRSPKSEAQRLERESVGGKELTGFSENNCPLVEPRDRDSARFSTHYQQRYAILGRMIRASSCTSVSCTPNIKLSTKNLHCFYTSL